MYLLGEKKNWEESYVKTGEPARNLATFRNSTLSSQATIRLIVKDIKLRIRCASSDAVRNFCSKDSVLCTIDDNENIVFLYLVCN